MTETETRAIRHPSATISGVESALLLACEGRPVKVRKRFVLQSGGRAKP
jgi:hypothetical protein